jgi:hypothetical protein
VLSKAGQLFQKIEFCRSRSYLSDKFKFTISGAREISSMAEGNQTIMEKAEARFVDKQKKTAERNKATAEYVSEAKAREIKTARLRELRLAKEEADRAAEAANPTPKKKRVVKKAAATTEAKTEPKS